MSGTTRTVSRGGDRWACSVTTPPLKGANRQTMRAFLANLRGQASRVVLSDHSYVRRGTQAANVLVMGAAETGSTLHVDAATVSATLLTGDLFTLGGYLYMVTADATANGSGQMTLSIVPPLRSTPADNAAVTITTPTARFLLTGNSVGWNNVPGGISSFACEFVEDIAV